MCLLGANLCIHRHGYQDRRGRCRGRCQSRRRRCTCNKTGKVSISKFRSTCSSTYPIQSVKEGIEKIGGCNLLRLIKLVINLIESDGLWVDQGVPVHGCQLSDSSHRSISTLDSRQVNVNIGLAAVKRAGSRHREVGSVDQSRDRICTLRHPRSVFLIEEV